MKIVEETLASSFIKAEHKWATIRALSRYHTYVLGIFSKSRGQVY